MPFYGLGGRSLAAREPSGAIALFVSWELDFRWAFLN